jgi:hypothetical protein
MNDNLCTLFLLPLLGIPKEVIRSKNGRERRIVNCFMYDEDIEAYRENHLFVVHTNWQDKQFLDWENKLFGQEHCIEGYDILDTKIGIKVFNMEPYDDYYKFLEGKYSQYSSWGKNRIIEHGIASNIIPKMVVEKSSTLKKQLSEKYGVAEDLFDECAPLWDSAEISNVLNASVVEHLKKITKR